MLHISFRILLFFPVMLLGMVGCAHYPINKPLDSVNRAVRPALPEHPDNAQDLLVILSLSGGGTRSAAFSYGVMEALRDVEFEWQGRRLRLLDQVDHISALSGSGFVATYYALNKERFFSDFERKFLKKDIEWGMIRHVYLNPITLIRIQSPRFGRTDAIAEYFDRLLFHGATMGDLERKGPPQVHLQATDITFGSRITLSREFFDYICSDFGSFPVSRAVAASTAMIGLLTPVTLHNHADQCHAAIREKISALAIDHRKDPEAFQQKEKITSLLNSSKRPYLHLVDGGLTGSLSVRSAYEHFFFARAFRAELGFPPPEIPSTVLIISVDAAEEPNDRWDQSKAGPGLATIFYNSTKFMLDEYNLDTVVDLAHMSHKLQNPQECFEAIEESHPCENFRFHFVHIDFYGIKDQALHDQVRWLPANYSLPARDVDALIQAGREALRDSGDLKEFIDMIQK